jgi:PBSX family phage terminase large subunit
MTLTEFNAQASEGQKYVLTCPERFPVVVTGIQAGKTTVGAVWLCAKLYKDYQAGIKGDYLIAAPTVKILQQSTLPKFREIFPSDWGVWKENSKVFELKWGGHVFVRSTDDPDYLEGMTLLAAWLDEAGQMKETVWINVQGRLSIAKGPCLLTTTPYNLGWFNRTIVKNAKRVVEMEEQGEGSRKFLAKENIRDVGDSTIAGFSWPSNHNPAFPQDEYERMKKQLSKAIFDRRYNGKFTALEGLVYPDFDQAIDFVDPFPVPAEWERFGGQDFGKENPTCILGVSRNPEDNVYYIFKEFYKSSSLLAEQADFISSNGLRQVWADPQSAQLILELNRTYHCGQVKGADNDIDLGIQRITLLFKNHQLKIFKNCINLRDELESYHYPKPDGDGATNDKPVAKKNHACDALRYAFSKGQGKKLRPMDPLNQGINNKRGKYRGAITRDMLTPNPITGY